MQADILVLLISLTPPAPLAQLCLICINHNQKKVKHDWMLNQNTSLLLSPFEQNKMIHPNKKISIIATKVF